MVLLTIFQLKGDSYLVNIREHLINTTGKEWSISSVFVPLDRLEKAGYLTTYTGDPEPKRGGKAIKYYRLTNAAVKALEEVKALHNTFWNDIEEIAIEG